jgi:hypothetical protein
MGPLLHFGVKRRGVAVDPNEFLREIEIPSEMPNAPTGRVIVVPTIP